MDTAATERGRTGDENQQRAAPYTRRTTDDRDEAERVITELYLPNRLDLSKSSEPMGMQVTGLHLGALTAGRLTYGRPVQLRTADAEDLRVNLALRGRAASRSDLRPAPPGQLRGGAAVPGAGGGPAGHVGRPCKPFVILLYVAGCATLFWPRPRTQ